MNPLYKTQVVIHNTTLTENSKYFVFFSNISHKKHLYGSFHYKTFSRSLGICISNASLLMINFEYIRV